MQKFFATKIGKCRDEAAKALAEVGLTPENVSDFTASVGRYGVGVCGCLPDEITSAWSDEPFASKTLEPDDASDRAWIAAEILALCHYAERKQTEGIALFLVGERLAEAVAALRDPEKGREYMRKHFARAGRKGGKAHHSDTRQQFLNDYRAERGDDPQKAPPRHKTVASLQKLYKDVARTTLEKWAVEADREDGFKRPPGRPKKGWRRSLKGGFNPVKSSI